VCVFCGRGLDGVVDAGGVLVGRCWVRLTAVSATRRAGGDPSSTQNRRLSATERLCRRRREQDRGKAGEIPSLNFHFFPVLFLLRRFTGGVCSQGSEVSCCAEDFYSRAAGAAEG